MILNLFYTLPSPPTYFWYASERGLVLVGSQSKTWLPRGKLKSAWYFAVLFPPPSSPAKRFCLFYSMREAFKNEKSTTSRRYLREKPRKRSQIVCVPYIQVMSQSGVSFTCLSFHTQKMLLQMPQILIIKTQMALKYQTF